MFLKSLTISGNKGVIREIKFRQGINLIVDETPEDDVKTSGNGVGKTTVLRLVDFCLGGSAEQIYSDPEDKKKQDQLVKDFLEQNEILVTLVLKQDLSKEDSLEICIERNFLKKKQKVLRFNGQEKTEDEFEKSLTDILFPEHYAKKPTFRQIISHNIRHRDWSINNTLKTLHEYTSDTEYEALYLFLFGCYIDLADKRKLQKDIQQEESFKKRLEEGGQTKASYEMTLQVLERDIEMLQAQKAKFNLNEDFESDLEKLNQVKYQINLLSSEISRLQMRREMIVEAKKELENSQSYIDLNQLRLIYEQVTHQLGKLQKSFEELYKFHNQMIDEKIRYIGKDLPRLEKDINSKSEHLKRLLQEEKQLTLALSRREPLEELEKLIIQLNDKHEKKGKYTEIVAQITKVENRLKELNQRLNCLDDELFSDIFENRVKEQLGKFNGYFASISHALYGEQYALKVDDETNRKGQRFHKFTSFNINSSAGKKQGEISCFDIAYTLFADEEGIPCFHFLLNDKKELMHDNQLIKIAELVNEKNIQFVASILKDKLPDELNQEEYFILQLSQSDKLFRIENYIT